jgi:ATP synthase protein I
MADENGQAPFGDFDTRLKRARDADPDRRPEREQGARGCAGAAASRRDRALRRRPGRPAPRLRLDSWLGTRPLFLIVFFLLGAVAGMLNAYRFLRRAQREDS